MPHTKELQVEEIPLKKAALVLRALRHKLRMNILRLIHEEKSIIVTDIYQRLRLEQSVASQHLGILRQAGLVETDRKGKYIYYRVNYQRLSEINQLVKDLLNTAPGAV